MRSLIILILSIIFLPSSIFAEPFSDEKFEFNKDTKNDPKKSNWYIEGRTQYSGTPNQLGIGVFRPLKLKKNSLSFFDFQINTEFGEFRVQLFSDLIRGETHIALIMGNPIPSRPCLVRVHIPDTFRDLVQVEWSGRGSWPLAKALKKVSSVCEAVVVILPTPLQEHLSKNLCDYLNDNIASPSQRVAPYLTVGTGSQILKQAGVGKMRLLSAPMRFGALSGFDLEVVEYVEF